ncbi:hypothetical protein QR680_010364 [Steinernema hermaphroditum]|uniref:Dynamitin n=1 Tax=Steinernema hermaphroditum TaxID=289476 RepID=A0AA39MAJ6_9BILA|nr:hypothetical protein QR680_010364 [Steinernema hermaphroditum]
MATQNWEVFATPDCPKEKEKPVKRDETIDALVNKFKGRMLNTDHVGRRREYVLEVAGKENAERKHETVEQKFNRLYCEVGELAEMVQIEARSGNSGVQEVNVKALSDLLDMVQKEKLHGIIPSESALEKLRKVKEQKKESADNVSSDVDFSNLDDRLKRIEKFVSGNRPTVTSTPLAETVEELRLRIETVNPSVLNGLETKLNTVLSKYQAAEVKRREKIDKVVEEKINHLTEMMTKWDGVCMSLPGTVKRLHALTNLHEQARDFSVNLQLLISTKNELLRKLESEGASIFELKKEALEMIRSLNSRVSSVQAAVDSLKK